MTAPGTQSTTVTVLAIDDEPANLELFERVFRKQVDWRYLSALSGESGLELIRSHGVDVLLVDYSMPTMSGVEFIEKARQIAPGVVAIMVTGYGELDAVVSALNRGLVHQIVAKPWRVGDLEGAVRRALTIKSLQVTAEKLQSRTPRQ